MDYTCITALGVLSTAYLGLVKVFLDNRRKNEKKAEKLEKNDQKQEQKDQEHEQRIKKIEEKNGHEQHQIDELKENNKELKTELSEVKKDKGELKDMVIKLQNRIINCEKQNGHKETPKNHQQKPWKKVKK